MMAMQNSMEIMFILLLGIAQAISGKTTSKRCATPMTLERKITFVTPMEPTTHQSQKYLYNMTTYWYGELLCRFTDLAEDREAYECITGDLLNKRSQILDSRSKELALLNNPACITNDSPKMTPNSLVYFKCMDTQTVQPTIHCEDSSAHCYVKPISCHHILVKGVSTTFANAIDNRIFRGSLLCPFTFACSWHTCSGYRILGVEAEGNSEALILRERHLMHLLDGLLETFSIPTSFEIINTNLTYLPDTMCKYSHLERLVIAGSNLKVLPTCLYKMVKLKILDASFNALKSIQNITFGSEQNTTYLDLSFNQITQIDKDAFSKLSSLVFLSLRSNALTEIKFALPKYLEVLDISNNSIKYLPSFHAIWKLTNIRRLVLNRNDIKSIDFKIPSSLEFLDLSSNKIGSVAGHTFEIATNLAKLLLYNNQIKEFRLPYNNFPGTDLILSNLKSVYLSNNQLGDLDESLFRQKMEHLDLSYNQLKMVDLHLLQEANNLKTLFLQHNNITVINDDILNGIKEITVLPNIEFINFSHNKLKTAPLSLIFLNVKMIDFSYNEIVNCTWSNMTEVYILKNIDTKIKRSCLSDDPNEEDQAQNLIDLRHNRITSFKGVFSRLSIMVHKYNTMFCRILFGHNPFHCDCNMYPYLRSLHDGIKQAKVHKELDMPISMVPNWMIPKRASDWNEPAGNSMKCNTPNSFKSRNVMDNELCDQLICNLLPQQECEFIFQPATQKLIVNCSNKNLQHIRFVKESLFIALEKAKNENNVPLGITTHVYLNDNNFSSINLEKNEKQFEAWFKPFQRQLLEAHIEVLDLSHSKIGEMDSHFFFNLIHLPHLSYLYLNDNNLTNLPFGKLFLYLETQPKEDRHDFVPLGYKMTELHLYNNPWDCSCESKWMKIWLNKLIARKIIAKPDEIRCATPELNRGQIVYMVEDSHFCIHEVYTAACSVIMTIILATSLLWYLFYRRVLKMDKHERELPLVELTREVIEDDDDIISMEFDAFVSYCEADSEWVEQELIPKLQQNNPPYKVCYHKRHFQAGMPSEWNEFNAIRHSRRTIIIMSDSYLKREHCRFEFTAAYSFWISGKKSPRLVVIKYPNVPIDNDHKVCSAYFRHFTYLELNEHTFDRLFQFMPEKSLAQLMNGNINPASMILPSENPTMTVQGEEQDNLDPYEVNLREEDEKYKRLWQEAEEETAVRVAAGEEITAEEIFLTKF